MGLLLAGAATGCVKDSANDYDVAVELAFRPAHYAPVRAENAAEEELFPTAMTFAATVWQLAAGQRWNYDAAEATTLLDSEPVSYDGAWSPATATLWPDRHHTLTAIGYAPVGSAERCTKDEGVVFAVDTRTEQRDLIYTTLQAERTKFTDDGVINLPFRHALAEMSFRVKNQVYDGERITIRRISVEEIAVEGTFSSLPEAAWSVSALRDGVEFFAGEGATAYDPAPMGRTVKVIPQGVRSGVTVEYDYTTAAGATIPATITTAPLNLSVEAGRHYVLTLSVSMNAAKVVEREICNQRLNGEQ